MTTPSTPRKAGPLLGTGTQTSWPFTFKVFAASDIAVTIANNLGVETALVLNADYSVTLNSNQDTSPGGTVTYPISGSALPTGSKLTIFGNLPYDQPLDLPSGGNFSPLALENELDRLTMQIQQLRENVGRALQLPVTSAPTNVQLPQPTASNLIGWNESGDNLENYPLSELATSLAFATYRYDTFTGNGSTTQFTLSADPVTLGNLDVAISGVTQVPGTDYTLVAGVLAFTSAPANGTVILARFGEGIVSGPSMDSYDVRFKQAGTGAVTRTVEGKLRESVSVADFGAVGDGVTDDTASIQAALNYATSINGLNIFFPAGEYICNGTLALTNPIAVNLFGEGADNTALGGTEIIYTGTASAFITFTGVNSRMYTFEGIHFRATNASFTGTVLKTGGFDVSMVKCAISAPGGALYLLDLATNASVDVHLDQVRFLGAQYGINGDGSNAVVLTQCSFDNQTVACVLNTGQAWGFDGCSFEPLVEVGGVRAPSAILNTVAGLGCSVRNCWLGDASDASGTVVGSANWITWQGDGLEISGCHINGAGNNKYGAVKINGATNGVTITSNYFSNFDYAIDLGSSLAYNVTVLSNRMRNMQSLSRGTIGGGVFLSQEFVFAGTFQTGSAFQNSGAYHSNSTGTAFRAKNSPSTLMRVDTTSLGFVAGDLSQILHVQSSEGSVYQTGMFATQYDAFPDNIGWRITVQVGAGVSRNALIIREHVTPGVDNVSYSGTAGLRWARAYATEFRPGAGATLWTSGSGTPEGAVTAPVGSLFTRTNGGAGTTLYVKETGTGNTGWVAK